MSNATSNADGLLTSTDDHFEQFRTLGSLLIGTFLGLMSQLSCEFTWAVVYVGSKLT
ncbi:hypothetical protein TRAPUB_1920 [Trametes pubescens]|uniref:Uncharacterized protein n=1 Tax=Trametes pubescens TaxID=154538 RepID=A0A1M2VI99_TRAPU|nr:hypothetical protein TRAPUB_1920 [Trametes pubescens]